MTYKGNLPFSMYFHKVLGKLVIYQSSSIALYTLQYGLMVYSAGIPLSMEQLKESHEMLFKVKQTRCKFSIRQSANRHSFYICFFIYFFSFVKVFFDNSTLDKSTVLD